MQRRLVLTACLALAAVEGLLVFAGADKAAVPKLDYDRDIRPILSENCFKCHGFDAGARKAGLRLDNAEGAYAKLQTGNVAVVPGNLNSSVLVERVSSKTMPPPDSGKKLTAAQIATLKSWIQQGAKYGKHWAFVTPARPPIPGSAPNAERQTPNAKLWSWCRNPIDNFILDRLIKEKLQPSPEADKRTLIRRVTLDLTGLPPTLKEVNTFLADTSPNAYEKVVDRLRASPHFGERMALQWLDLARYADTHGYHIDSGREMWRWRDWVIDAYNKNIPYDQFVVKQLAGDLLPNATLEDRIATGFNRNHPINFEGGAIPEEYAAAYIEDRIDTTSTTFMALTLRCAQCHDHKYDPFTSRDYYRIFAYFNNVPEQGLDGTKGNAAPFIKAPLAGQQEQLDELNKRVLEADNAVKARAVAAVTDLAKWEEKTIASFGKGPSVASGLVAQYPLDENSGDAIHEATGKQPAGKVVGKAAWADGKFGKAFNFDGTTHCDVGSGISFERTDKFSYGAWVYPTSGDGVTVISCMDDANKIRGWDMFLGGSKVFAHLISEWENNAIRVNTKDSIELNKWHHLFVTFDGSSKAKGVHIYVDGKLAELEHTHDTLTGPIATHKQLNIGSRNPAGPFKGMIQDVRIYNRELNASEIDQLANFEAVRQLLSLDKSNRSAEQQETISRYYLQNADAEYKRLSKELLDRTKKRNDFDASIPTTMVMEEMPKPRDTFMLVRGQYDKHGEKVTPALPAVLEETTCEFPPNRLGMAEWLVDPSHPLTARVAVNRYWQMYFGTGLVKTSENFGTQGERPSHPELLDWLGTEFIRTGWDVKQMQKLIVTSATYRQSSKATEQMLEKDPENRLLARAPRFRMTGEFVRDQALALSGLLVPKIGGPSVKPYHPPGLWEEMAFGGEFSEQKYVQDHGDKLYRRSMYTFWKRTVPPPSLQTFDAPEREFCIVRRSVTNTPLQALVLMDDPTYVEASRKFAERILTEAPSSDMRQRIAWAFTSATARPPKPSETDVLAAALSTQLARFAKDRPAAEKLLSIGESPKNTKLDEVELAAWSTVASMIMNLDETLTKG